MQRLAGGRWGIPSRCSGAVALRSRYARTGLLATLAAREIGRWAKKRWAASCWWVVELREYDANLVELWEGLTYGEGVGSNDANDETKE